MSKQARILVVDDEEPIRELCGQVLEYAGYTVVTAAGYEEAMTCLESSGFDLMVTDILMPGKSGFDLMRDARAIVPDLPIVVLTGYWTMQGDAKKWGADAVFVKPFLQEEFLDVIRNILHMRVMKQ